MRRSEGLHSKDGRVREQGECYGDPAGIIAYLIDLGIRVWDPNTAVPAAAPPITHRLGPLYPSHAAEYLGGEVSHFDQA